MNFKFLNNTGNQLQTHYIRIKLFSDDEMFLKIQTKKNKNEVNDIINLLDHNISYDVNIRNKILCSLTPYFNRIELVVYPETFVPL